MLIINKDIETKIIEKKCIDESGLTTLNGFSFQFSNAIYEIIKRFERNEDFSIIFESHDDFLIIDETSLYLFQAKNYKTTTFTAGNLSKGEDKSILGKMSQARQNISGLITDNVRNYLIINNDKAKIGLVVKDENKKAYSLEEYENEICLNFISDNCKESILTVLHEDVLDSFYVKRQLRYDKHVDDVRLSIEDVLNEKYTEPKTNLLSIYDFLERRIRNSMEEKKYYSLNEMNKDIGDIINFQNDRFESFSELKYLLDDYTAGITHLIKNRYKEYVSVITSSKINDIYDDFILLRKTLSIDNLLNETLCKIDISELTNIYDPEQLIALILLVYGERKI